MPLLYLITGSLTCTVHARQFQDSSFFIPGFCNPYPETRDRSLHMIYLSAADGDHPVLMKHTSESQNRYFFTVVTLYNATPTMIHITALLSFTNRCKHANPLFTGYEKRDRYFSPAGREFTNLETRRFYR